MSSKKKKKTAPHQGRMRLWRPKDEWLADGRLCFLMDYHSNLTDCEFTVDSHYSSNRVV